MTRSSHDWGSPLYSLVAARRRFLQQCPLGLGGMALASLLADDARAGEADSSTPPRTRATDPLAPLAPHFAPRAKRVIFLFMAGGPSQLELFEPKPALQQLDGQVIPESFVKGKRFAFIKPDAKLLGTKRKFAPHGESGQVIGDLLPHLGKVADELCLLRAVKTDVFNHGPAKFFLNTGSPLFGRPSMGAWITYGIGSESQNLPGFVVLQSGPRGPRGGSPNWGSGFLPSAYQGVPFRGVGAPILNLESPPGVSRDGQQRFTQAVNDLNRLRLAETGDGEIAARIAAYEMAFRMQASAPELMDLSGETQQTLDSYGVTPGKSSFAANCLLARRLVERGVRFVQLYHTDWDHHGNKGTELGESLDKICAETDQPAAALVHDLRQRGLLDDTLVVWSGEFGRTPQGEPREMLGRDHHVEAFTLWLAGGGVKAGLSLGKTDEIGYNGVEDQVHIHDLHATLLHLMGLDHKRLSVRFQGLDMRLTGVAGHLVQKMLA